MRSTLLILTTAITVGVAALAPTAASAQHRGGGWHGGHGGWHGGRIRQGSIPVLEAFHALATITTGAYG